MKKDISSLPIHELLKGKKLPVLVLDQRWHKLFSGGKKPDDIAALETELNRLLKEQGKSIQTVKELKAAKKKLMEAIVSNMSSQSEKKREKQQKLLLDANERLEKESMRLMDIPHEIKQVNEQLLIRGVQYCYGDWKTRSEKLEKLTQEIETMRMELKQMVADRVDLEESIDVTYSLMHGLVGGEIMNLFDISKG